MQLEQYISAIKHYSVLESHFFIKHIIQLTFTHVAISIIHSIYCLLVFIFIDVPQFIAHCLAEDCLKAFQLLTIAKRNHYEYLHLGYCGDFLCDTIEKIYKRGIYGPCGKGMGTKK